MGPHGECMASDSSGEMGGAGQLAQYASLFERHHISGRSLFVLTSEDLLDMGIFSTGHRKELLAEVEMLRRANHRLLHFPPLQLQVREERSWCKGRGLPPPVRSASVNSE